MKKAQVYSPQFLLLCTSSFLFFSSFNMIIPELPAYLSSLGGEDYKGLIIALFALSACLSRPFSGKLADNIGRIPIIFIGIFMSLICGLLYPILNTLVGFFLLRFLHGFSTGFTPTGTAAYIADIIPPNRRGEAIGFLGLISNIGTAIGPPLGSEIAQRLSLDVMFYTSSLMAAFSLALLWNLQETLTHKNNFKITYLYIKKHEIIDWKVIAPSLVMLLSMFAFGAMLTVIPDFSTHLGIKNKGLFFVFYTLSTLTTRLIAGKASDQYGRIVVMQSGLFILSLALIWLAFTDSVWELLVGGCLYGIGTGICSPTIFAWAIDLSEEHLRGRAIATVYIALEIGIGIGALASGAIYNNQPIGLSYVFAWSAFFSILAFGYLSIMAWGSLRK